MSCLPLFRNVAAAVTKLLRRNGSPAIFLAAIVFLSNADRPERGLLIGVAFVKLAQFELHDSKLVVYFSRQNISVLIVPSPVILQG